MKMVIWYSFKEIIMPEDNLYRTSLSEHFSYVECICTYLVNAYMIVKVMLSFFEVLPKQLWRKQITLEE